MPNGIVRFGNFVPRDIREWDKVFQPLNRAITTEANGSVAVEGMAPDTARYVLIALDAELPNARRLVATAGHLTLDDDGSNLTAALAEVGTPGTYAKVTTDATGRVSAGSSLEAADIPELDTAKITSGTFANARIAASNVTQHQAALSIAETQIPDGSVLARVAADETVSGNWEFSGDLGFFGATAVAQQSGTGETVGFTAGSGTAVNDDSTFTGNVGSTAYRISDIVKALKNLGLLAS